MAAAGLDVHAGQLKQAVPQSRRFRAYSVCLSAQGLLGKASPSGSVVTLQPSAASRGGRGSTAEGKPDAGGGAGRDDALEQAIAASLADSGTGWGTCGGRWCVP
jgi:hypothetical protein